MKQPNWKTPLLLSATLLVFGTFAYWLQYSHKPKKDKSDLLTKKPIALATDDTQVAMIKIKSNRGLIELKCESLAEKKCTGSALGKWTISHPAGPRGELYPADASEVKDFLNTAANAIATEVIDLTEETPEKRKALLSEYGLSDDKRANAETQFLELIVDGGKRLTAWFGVEHPIGDKTFVASAVDGTINDKVIYLLSNQTKSSNFGKTVTNFRDKTLFTFDRKDVTEFSAKVTAEKRNGGKIVAKRVDALWTVNDYPANFDRIETVLSAISNAKAVDFVDTSLIKGLNPVVSYELKAGDKTYSVMLYEKKLAEKKLPQKDAHGHTESIPAEKHYYLQSSEKKELVEVEALLRSNLDKSLLDLRNTSMMTETEKVTATRFKVEAAGYGASPEFSYEKGKWQAKDPTKNWDPALVSKLLDIFTTTRIKDFVSPPPAGKELYQIAIGDEKNPGKFNFSFYRVKDDVYARDLSEKSSAKPKEAYLLEDSMKTALPKTETEWKIKSTPTK